MVKQKIGVTGSCKAARVNHSFAMVIALLLSNIGNEKDVVLGIGAGYPDPNHPVNQVESEHVPLDEIVRFYYFTIKSMILFE